MTNLDLHKKMGLLTEDGMPNEKAGFVEEIGNGWKRLTVPFRDPVHGMCKSVIHFKPNEKQEFLINDTVMVEKASEK